MLRVYTSRGIAVALSCARFISFVARITIFKLVAQQRYANSKKSRRLCSPYIFDAQLWGGTGIGIAFGIGIGIGIGILGLPAKSAKAHDEADFVEHGPFVCFSLFAVRSGMLAIYTKGELERREGGRDSIRVRARWQKQILVFGMHKKCANKA